MRGRIVRGRPPRRRSVGAHLGAIAVLLDARGPLGEDKVAKARTLGLDDPGVETRFSRRMRGCAPDQELWSLQMRSIVLTAALGALGALVVLPAQAADPTPEIRRDPGKPQAVGAAHTLRQIPEACARLEGMFTGDPAQPYRFAVVRTSPACQPRARFVDAAKAQPGEAAGWKFNDIIRVPSAACATQQAVVRVWRKPAGPLPRRDGQGQARIYLEESVARAKAGKLAAIPMFAASMKVEGVPCV